VRISAYGLAVDVPSGWEARIRRHPLALQPAGDGFRAHPVLHAGDFVLPEERGDFGSGAVETMGPAQAFIALIEYDPSSAGTALFSSNVAMPFRVGAGDFSTQQLQRTRGGQAGTQRFFVDGGRAFCLYVVLGSMAGRHHAVPRVNAVLSAIEITPRVAPDLAELL
jgi:hypothetical protein